MDKSETWKNKNQELIKYLSQAIGPDDSKVRARCDRQERKKRAQETIIYFN